jgi:hypothetical protein
MEDHSGTNIDDTLKSQVGTVSHYGEEASGMDPNSEERINSPNAQQDEVSLDGSEYERGSTDLLRRFRGLGLISNEESPVDHIREEGFDEQISQEPDGMMGGTAELLSTLAAIEADSKDESLRIVDEIEDEKEESNRDGIEITIKDIIWLEDLSQNS